MSNDYDAQKMAESVARQCNYASVARNGESPVQQWLRIIDDLRSHGFLIVFAPKDDKP